MHPSTAPVLPQLGNSSALLSTTHCPTTHAFFLRSNCGHLQRSWTSVCWRSLASLRGIHCKAARRRGSACHALLEVAACPAQSNAA